MITLHEAIRSVQDELIKSQQEREQKGDPPLFKTEKLTIELSCVFSETDSTDVKGGINALSVFALDADTVNSVSSEKVQKIILELKAADLKAAESAGGAQSAEAASGRSIPSHKENVKGLYPYGNNA